MDVRMVAEGVWRLRLGRPETMTPDDGESLACRKGAVNTVRLAWHERLGRVEITRSGEAPVPGYVAGEATRYRG